MFDQYRFVAGPTYGHVAANITEKRAPTDESVRLLREMEAAAEVEIVKKTVVHDNDFSCVVHQWREAMMDSTKFKVIWSIGGHKCTTDFTWERWRQGDDKRAMLIGLRDALARDIAGEMLSTAINRMEFPI